MNRRKVRDSLVADVEGALAPGEFVGWKQSSVFVAGLEAAKERIGVLVTGGDPAAAVDLYEIFIAACYEKADEVDDSDGAFGTFAGTLFPAWIRARQASGSDPDETSDTAGLVARPHRGRGCRQRLTGAEQQGRVASPWRPLIP